MSALEDIDDGDLGGLPGVWQPGRARTALLSVVWDAPRLCGRFGPTPVVDAGALVTG